MIDSKFPFEPKQGYKFVDMKNKYMQEALKAAKELSWDTGFNKIIPIGAVFVKDSKVVLSSGSGSLYHTKNGCDRVKMGLVGGDYELCPGCSYKVHCEAKAIEKAKTEGIDLSGADVYMFGHFWCCENCCKRMEEAGIKDIYLLENGIDLFDRKKSSCKCADWEYFTSLIKQ